ARDLRRYLAGEPIEAKRDSGLYLLRKALQRYRAPVAAGGAFVVLLIVGLCVALMLWHRAVTAEKEAKASENRAIAAKQQAETAEKLQEQERIKAQKASIDAGNARDAEASAHAKAERSRNQFAELADCLSTLLLEKGNFADAEWKFRKVEEA